jgi:hypothetical protein
MGRFYLQSNTARIVPSTLTINGMSHYSGPTKYEVSRGVKTNGLEIDRSMFKVSNGFAVGALMILGMLAALYTIFW